MSGSLRVVDYLRVRADGRRELELRGDIETDDGNRIAFAAEGVGTPRTGGPIVDLAVRIDLLTAAGPYFWVNAKPLGVPAMRISPPTRSTSTSTCTDARAAGAQRADRDKQSRQTDEFPGGPQSPRHQQAVDLRSLNHVVGE